MDKKLSLSIIVLILLGGFTISLMDLGKSNLSPEEQIAAFINENLEEDTQYKPIEFKLIDEAFLMSQEKVTASLATIEDSIGNQLELLNAHFVSLDFQNLLAEAQQAHNQLRLETISGYLNLDARLKRTLKKYRGMDQPSRQMLYQEETRMLLAVNELNASLSQYNLSLFSLDLEASDNLRYWHQYELTDAQGSSILNGVFELEKEPQQVISFREIG